MICQSSDAASWGLREVSLRAFKGDPAPKRFSFLLKDISYSASKKSVGNK